MALNSVFDLSQTAGSNTDFGGTSVLGTGLVSTADDSFRTLASFLAKWRDDLGATATTAGTNTVTATLNQTFTAYTTGQLVMVKLGGTNTGAATANWNSLGAKNVKVVDSEGTLCDPPPGAMLINNYALFRYDGTNQVLLNPANVLVDSNAGAAVGPVLNLFRDSASPAVNDLLGQIIFNGRDSAANVQEYGSIQVSIADPVSTSEDSAIDFYAPVAGARTRIASFGPNLDLPTGQIAFPATQVPSSGANVLDDYEEGTWTPALTLNSSATGITYSTQTGTYVKIGKLVFLTGSITLTSKGASTGGASLTGLPFTSASNGSSASIYFSGWNNMSSIVGNPFIEVIDATTTGSVSMSGAAAYANLTNSNFANNSSILFSGCYTASA